MEPVGAFLCEEWGWLSRMLSAGEGDFMAHLHGCNDESENGFSFGTSSTFWPIDEAKMNMGGVYGSSFDSSHTVSSDIHYFSQESGSNNVPFPTPGHENHYLSDSNHIQETNGALQFMNFNAMDDRSNSLIPTFAENLMENMLRVEEEIMGDKLGNADSQLATAADTGKELQLKRKIDMPEPHTGAGEENNNDLSEAPKKKPRVSRNARKGEKNVTSQKYQKLSALSGNDDELPIAGANSQSSSCCSSENDSNDLDSKGNVAHDSNGKARASRGAATDPQSLYARRRRERINERLRILQNLVPNGAKVDISTMLEEAVHYVKFLQLQIKLLSSDDLWMYAPIAYNGFDIGLYSRISPT